MENKNKIFIQFSSLINFLPAVWSQSGVGRASSQSSETRSEPVDSEVDWEAGLTTASLEAECEGGAVVTSSQIKPRQHEHDSHQTVQTGGQARPAAEAGGVQYEEAREAAAQGAQELHHDPRQQRHLQVVRTLGTAGGLLHSH